MRFDIQRMVCDLGGASAVASSLGITRTIPYAWVRRGMISSTYLARLKEVNKRLNLNKYIIEGQENGDIKRSS